MVVGIKDLIKGELIGLKTEIADSKNKANIGIKGKIIDETKNTIVIQNKNKQKRLFKNNITLKLKLNGKIIGIKGGLFSGKPKERIKNGKIKNKKHWN